MESAARRIWRRPGEQSASPCVHAISAPCAKEAVPPLVRSRLCWSKEVPMRHALIIAVLLAVAAQAHAAKRAKKPSGPPPTPILRLSNDEQTAEDANSGAGSPLLEWTRSNGPVTGPNGAPMDVIPEFRVTVMRSPVVMRRRELVNSDGAFKDTQMASYAVDIPAGSLQNGIIAS